MTLNNDNPLFLEVCNNESKQAMAELGQAQVKDEAVVKVEVVVVEVVFENLSKTIGY